MSNVVNGFVGAIGNTPLLLLKHLSKATGCNIYGKAEFSITINISFLVNPGGSVKDRAALYCVLDAEKRGIKAGGTIVEGTAGNTGIGTGSFV